MFFRFFFLSHNFLRSVYLRNVYLSINKSRREKNGIENILIKEIVFLEEETNRKTLLAKLNCFGLLIFETLLLLYKEE